MSRAHRTWGQPAPTPPRPATARAGWIGAALAVALSVGALWMAQRHLPTGVFTGTRAQVAWTQPLEAEDRRWFCVCPPDADSLRGWLAHYGLHSDQAWVSDGERVVELTPAESGIPRMRSGCLWVAHILAVRPPAPPRGRDGRPAPCPP